MSQSFTYMHVSSDTAVSFKSELPMGWVDRGVGSGWVGSRFCSFRWVGLARVEYGKSTIFFEDVTTYNCIPVELLGSSGKVYRLIICAVQ